MTAAEDEVPPPRVTPRYCPACLDRWAWGSTEVERDRIHPTCRVVLEQAWAS